MPPTAAGWGMSADSDLCGSGTTLLSTATMNVGVDATQGPGYLTFFVEFDHDWRTIQPADPLQEMGLSQLGSRATRHRWQ